jgi:hypothetical protein
MRNEGGGRRLGLTKAAVSLWEKGTGKLTRPQLIAITEFCMERAKQRVAEAQNNAQQQITEAQNNAQKWQATRRSVEKDSRSWRRVRSDVALADSPAAASGV